MGTALNFKLLTLLRTVKRMTSKLMRVANVAVARQLMPKFLQHTFGKGK